MKEYDLTKWIEGTVCPCCGSTDFKAEDIDTEHESVFRDWCCNECDAEWSETYSLTEISAKEGEITLEVKDTDALIAKTRNFAIEKIEALCDLLIEAPIEDFEDFFKTNHHLIKEVAYDLGIIQGYAEALEVAGHYSLGSKVDEILEMMQEGFDNA